MPENVIRLPMAAAQPARPEEELFSGAFAPTEALNRLRARLLDLTRQNRLLHFRHPKGRSLQFVNVDIEASFRRLADGGICALTWVPEPHRGEYAPGPRPEARDWAKDQLSWDTRTEVPLPTGNLPAGANAGRPLCTLLYPTDCDRITRAIARDAKTAIEETGVNVLHLIYGFLEFVESDDAERPLLAPLVAMPVSLNRQATADPRSGFYRYEILYSGDDYSENLTLREKLWQDFNIVLPEFDEEAGIEAYFERVRTLVHTKPGWRVRRQLSLGFLSFSKLALWHDLDPEQWPELGRHKVIRTLFQGNTSELGEPLSEHEPQSHPSYCELIFDADTSQNRAVMDVLSGRNLVIDGPPGTGKSQTITNIIATAMAAGKSVLFVSEKLAALQVVYRRLREAKLAPFLLELHSNKAQKKQLLEEIESRMRARFTLPIDHASKLAEFKKRHEQLQSYAKLLNSVSGNRLNMTVFDIFWAADRRRGSLAALAQEVESLDLSAAPNMTPEALAEATSVVQRLANHFDVVGDPGPNHVWHGFEIDRLVAGDDLRIAEAVRKHLRVAGNVRVATMELASLLQDEMLVLSPPALKAAAGAIEKVLEPAATVIADLLAGLYPKPEAQARTVAATVASFIDKLKALHKLQQAASRCRLDPAEATPSRVQAAREAVATLRTLLGPSASLGRAREAAVALAKAHRSIESAVDALAESACLAGIAFNDTRSDVTAVCAVSRIAQAAPRELLSWRHPGMAGAGASAQLDTIRTEHNQLHNDRARLETMFFLEPEPSTESLLAAIPVLRDADGLFSFLRSEVRVARRFYRRITRRSQRVHPRASAEHLADLHGFMSARRSFEGDVAHSALLGRLFAGMETDLARADSLIAWCAEAQRQLAQTGHPGFDYVGAPERAVLVLAETSEQTLALAQTLDSSALDAQLFVGENWIAGAAGTAGNWRKLATELLDAGRACANAYATLSALGNEAESPENLLSALESLAALPGARRELDEDQDAARVLGRHFAGSATVAGNLEATWEWGQALVRANLQEPFRGYLIDADMRARLPDLRQRLRTLADGWNNLALLPSVLASYGQLRPAQWLRVLDGEEETAPKHEAAAQRCLDALDDLLPWVQYRAARQEANAAGLGTFATLVEGGRMPSDRLTEAFEFAFYATIARSLSRTHGELARFSTTAHEQARTEFRNVDNSLKELNGTRLAHALSNRVVPLGTAGPSPKDYSEKQLLIHEIAKRRRHLAIRQLLARAGGAVKALKPCWMMSPLSVAHYVKPEAVHFDLVVMDEASQIRPEEALGAIARAAQVVVVGDANQLPPTSFFERSFESAEEDEREEESGAAFSGTQSILDVATQFYPTRELLWHYRSHHHSLIQFSNTRFYEGRLIVFPSPKERSAELGVTYHYVEGATYSSRQNLAEAKRVIDGVLEHVAVRDHLCLGVATLNLTQRNLIEELLEQRVRGDAKWNAFVAHWENEGHPFFVKNLENVQGDERDVILVSTTFGTPPGGTRPFQRFGPIGTPTGWRRLNVLFTRARIALHLYTSLRPEDIIVDESTRRGTAEFRYYLEYARDGRIGTAAPTDREPDSDFEVDVADLLRARGYEVVPQLGVAGFFIDIAVRNPHRRGEFLAAIECDGATYHSGLTVRDRDRLREKVLEDLGWKGKIYRIWSTDWFRGRGNESQKLLRFLNERAEESKPEIRAESAVPPAEPPPSPRQMSRPAPDQTQLQLSVEEAADEEHYVEVGDIVTYEFADVPGKHEQLRIVERETNLQTGEVNENAPLARALFDMAVGEENELRMPNKPVRKVRIIRIESPKRR